MKNPLKALCEERLYYSVSIESGDFFQKLPALLKKLGCDNVITSQDLKNLEKVRVIVTDSRFVTPNCLAILRSAQPEHILSALKNSRLVVHGLKDFQYGVYVPRLRSVIHQFLHEATGQITSDLAIFGVTGTKGKTTATYFIHQVCSYLKVPCAYIGTLGVMFRDHHVETLNTTPSLEFLLNTFVLLKKLGCRAVAIECSSIGLDQGRLDGVQFDGVLFTGLGRDHLDYHKTMSGYFLAKRRLFDLLTKSPKPRKSAVIVAGSKWSDKLVQSYSKKINITQIAPKSVRLLKASPKKSEFRVNSMKLRMNFFFPQFVVLALAVKSLIEGHFLKKLPLQILTKLKLPPGRFHLVGDFVIVDYAHTPESLEFAIRCLKQTFKKPVVTVFGCGGNRDPGKRPIMGRVASELSDYTIITSDNPRFEDPMSIIGDIYRGVCNRTKVEKIPNRRRAIQTAIKKAIELGGYALIAGKGHENYQIVGSRRSKFSDIDVAKKVLQS